MAWRRPSFLSTAPGRRAWALYRGRLAIISAIAVALFVFGVIAEEIAKGEPIAFDRAVLMAFRNPDNPSILLGPPWLHEAARDITSLGSVMVLGLILATVAGYLLMARKRAEAVLVVGAVVTGVILNSLLKAGFARPRPDLAAPSLRVFTESFPSGHAALSAVAYLTLGALLSQTHRTMEMRVFFIGIAIVVTALVGASRVYLGVHYPTDVLAGWSLGAAWAMGWWVVMNWLQARGELQQPQASS